MVEVIFWFTYFIPYPKIEGAFLELVGDCPYWSYIFRLRFLSTDIEPNTMFSPELWAHEPTLSPR